MSEKRDIFDIAEELVEAMECKSALIFTKGNAWCINVNKVDDDEAAPAAPADGWREIAEYDALPLKDRPHHCVFLFAPVIKERADLSLPQMVAVERRYGFRDCTHYMPLPPPPAPKGE